MSERNSDEIRREIERKRLEMDRTVDDLERKLTPAQLLDHALWLVRGSDTGSEKARRVADGLIGFARNHPIPVALMSAGAAWLAAESRREEHVGPGTYAPAEGRVGPYMGDALDEGPLRDDDGWDAAANGGPSVTDRVRGRVSDTAHGVGDKVHDAGDALRDRIHLMGDRVSDVKDGARERMHAAGESLRGTADAARERSAELARRTREQAALRGRQARDQYDRTLEDNPLVLGAAAFGIGLVAGLSAPPTGIESDYLGARSDALKDEARSIASDTARAAKAAARQAADVARREALPENIVDEVKGRVQRVASNAMTAARETARTEGLTRDNLVDRAKRVASDAANAARETARSEGLTADALKERAVEAGERVRDS